MRAKRSPGRLLTMLAVLAGCAVLCCASSGSAGEWRYVDDNGAVKATLQDVDTVPNQSQGATAASVDIDPLPDMAKPAPSVNSVRVMTSAPMFSAAPANAVVQRSYTVRTRIPRRSRVSVSAAVPMATYSAPMSYAVAPTTAYRVQYQAAPAYSSSLCPTCGRPLN